MNINETGQLSNKNNREFGGLINQLASFHEISTIVINYLQKLTRPVFNFGGSLKSAQLCMSNSYIIGFALYYPFNYSYLLQFIE